MSAESSLPRPRWLAALLRGPSALAPDGCCLETHISWVLLAGPQAFKFKKPLNLGFLDFSTLAQRRAACVEELRINRRTAPAIKINWTLTLERLRADQQKNKGTRALRV